MVTKASEPKRVEASFKKQNVLFGAIFAVGRYFKNSWAELKLVRWPNRRATWGMTAAVLIFSGLFLGLIIVLDAIFSKLFNIIIK